MQADAARGQVEVEQQGQPEEALQQLLRLKLVEPPGLRPEQLHGLDRHAHVLGEHRQLPEPCLFSLAQQLQAGTDGPGDGVGSALRTSRVERGEPPPVQHARDMLECSLECVAPAVDAVAQRTAD